jgi:hypothetical protein
MYETFKASVLGKVIGDGQCVSLVVNNPEAYTEHLWPNVNWETIFKPVPEARELFGDANSTYFEAIVNNHSDPNQLPQQGDVIVFDATPASGYTNTFNNPDGHCGICDSASSSGYALLQQNSPSSGSPVNVTEYAWKFRPCIGWLRPVGSPSPAPNPEPTGQTITLPETTGPWHLYAPGYAGNMSHVLGLIEPEVLHEALTYPILASLGNGVYRIKSEDYGIGDLWTNGSDVIIK